jgi:cell fate regulator YaaT (PSP1 superfamily)
MESEYLVSYGTLGDFGRFRPARPFVCRRGDRAVVRTHRGIEIGEVLRGADPGHAQFLPNTTVGTLLRIAAEQDERTALALSARAAEFCDEAGRLAGSLDLPLAVLDAEMLLDSEHAVLHFVRLAECDVRPLVSALSKSFAVHVLVQDLTRAEQHAEEHAHSCGSCGTGGCGDCGSGGCGTCGSAKPEEVQAHFAGLREQMEAASRVPLL